MHTIQSATSLGETANERLSDLFVDGFWPMLQAFKAPPERLKAALAPGFDPSSYAVAVEDGRLLAMAALSKKGHKPLTTSWRHLVKTVGPLLGTLLHVILKRELDTSAYPVDGLPEMGIIEYVVTDSAARGKGLAGEIINHLVERSAYPAYVLEVADNNTPARRLYERLGFKTVATRPTKHAARSGIKHFEYMVRPKTAVT